MDRPRVVIVGAGFGGLRAARSLADVPVDVVVVDRNSFHTFQPLLYQVATAALGADDIAQSVRAILRRQANASFRMATVTGIDAENRRLLVASGPHIPYDWLVLAAGATTDTYGVPGVAENAFFLKTLPQALELRNSVLVRFEEAASDPDGMDEGCLTFVVVGGGPTGVELAGALSELTHRVLAHELPAGVVASARVLLVEATDRLLGGLSPASGDYARRRLAAMGVELRMGATVEEVSDKGVRLAGGELVPAATVVWVAGVKAAGVAAHLGLPTGRGGRIQVEPDLSVPGHPEVLVIGDVGALPDGEGGVLPQLAPVAMQAGDHAARLVADRLAGGAGRPFRYRDKGTMATIGRHAAVAELPGKLRLRGFPAWVAWLFLHLLYLAGVRNRLNVAVNWLWSYLTHDRGARIILRAPSRRPVLDD